MNKNDNMTQLEQFCQILRNRSEEHKSAIVLLINNGLYGQAISILRQELDSLVRTIFLLNINSLPERLYYIQQTLNNEKWTKPSSKTLVTDKQMVELADTLYGWSKSVYKLGCAFIHLSPLLDYKNTNPFSLLEETEKNDIKQHLNNYHGFSLSSDLNMESINPYLTKVFDKVTNNLAIYISDLENNKLNCL